MTVIVPEPSLNEDNSANECPTEEEKYGKLTLDGGFVVPDSNAFGHSFRDYDKESQRKAIVEQFYRINHINQTYEFNGSQWRPFFLARKDYQTRHIQDWNL